MVGVAHHNALGTAPERVRKRVMRVVRGRNQQGGLVGRGWIYSKPIKGVKESYVEGLFHGRVGLVSPCGRLMRVATVIL